MTALLQYHNSMVRSIKNTQKVSPRQTKAQPKSTKKVAKSSPSATKKVPAKAKPIAKAKAKAVKSPKVAASKAPRKAAAKVAKVPSAPITTKAPPKPPKAPKAPKAAKSSGPKGYTPAQYEKFKEFKEKFQEYSNQKLKDLLKANSQSMTGNKDDLIYKCADGATLGRIPRCPKCFGGRPKFDYQKGTYYCSGYRDDVDFKNCHSTFQLSELTRDPWTDI